MSETPRLTEIEKAELLDAIPGDLPMRQVARRALRELDFLQAENARLTAALELSMMAASAALTPKSETR